MSIYRSTDYREVIQTLIKEKKKTDRSFSTAELAQKIGVQKTYVSMVLRGEREFSSDQIFLIAREFSLNGEELEYLLMLLEFARTGIADRKNELCTRIGAIQMQRQNLKKDVRRRVLESNPEQSEMIGFYLDPLNVVVRQFLVIKKYRDAPELIRRKLGLTQGQLDSFLERLRTMGLIKMNNAGKITEVSTESVHLPRQSPISGPHLNLFRLMAVHHLMKIPMDRRLSYSTTFRANERVRAQIQEGLLRLLKEVEPMIKNAPDEEVYEFSFDLFPWALD